MRKIDCFVLGILYKFSNWTYRKFLLNNYGIAAIILVLAVCASTMIAIKAFDLAETDKIARVAEIRRAVSIFSGFFFSGLAITFLYFQKSIGEFLSRQYDMEKTDLFLTNSSIFFRWFFVVFYPLSILIGNKWWGMLDTLFLGLALMFLSCKPPDMEIRMSKVFKN